jgi:hypothetical protein
MSGIPEKLVNLNEYDSISGRSPVPFEILLQPRFEGVGKVLAGELNMAQVSEKAGCGN